MKYLISLLLFTNVTFADSVGDKMTNMFNNLGVAANISGSDIHRGQEGTMAFAGSAYVRAPHESLSPFYYRPPGINIGDCGFDMHLGGFDFVNSEKFIEMARNIGASAAAHLFSLALKQVAPQIMNQIESIQEFANKANMFNINSCESAKYFTSKASDLLNTSAKRACQAKSLKDKEAKQAFSAREECQVPHVLNARLDEANVDPELVDSTLVDKNIAWYIINQHPGLTSLDDTNKHLLMNLTGTIIVKRNHEGNSVEELIPSRIITVNQNLIEGLSKGGNVELYTCDEPSKCLTVTKNDVLIESDKTLYKHVRDMLHGIENKMRTDSELDAEQAKFITQLDKQIYKLIRVQTAFMRNVPISFINEYVELVSLDLLYSYIENCINDVSQAFANNLFPEKYNERYISMINQARVALDNIRMKNAERASQRQELMLQVNAMQQKLTANISNEIMNKTSVSRDLRG